VKRGESLIKALKREVRGRNGNVNAQVNTEFPALSVAHKRGSEQLFVLEEAGHRLRQRTPAGPGGRQAGARATAANAQAGESTAAVASSERLVLPVSQ
jgi:hypothetical protein